MRSMFKFTQAVAVFISLVLVPNLAGFPVSFDSAHANGTHHGARHARPGDHVSVVRVSKADRLPVVRSVRIALNKSTLVEIPYELRDVVVSNPSIIDAVAQTSHRVHIIGKNVGQANAFFFNSHGEQVLRLEISVERDATVLNALLARLIPGSRIRVEMLNETAILTGSVPTPIASNRARDIASRFMVGPKFLKRTGRGSDARATKKVINLLGKL